MTGPGTVSHEEALDWADTQCGAFAARRRLEAEQAGGARYIEDLEATAKLLERKSRQVRPKLPRSRRKKRGAP